MGIPWNSRNHFLQPYTALDTLPLHIINSCYNPLPDCYNQCFWPQVYVATYVLAG